MTKLTNDHRPKSSDTVITIPAGKTQSDEFQMDSPVIKPESITISEAGISINCLYTYSQGSIVQRRLIRTELTEAEVEQMLGTTTYNTIITKAKQLALALLNNIEEHKDRLEEV